MNSQELLSLYRDGQTDAATAIFDRYVARLVALVRGRMSAKLQRRIDAEDVVQSAYRSFFLHAQAGAYRLEQAGDLWRLLASIALHKLHRQIDRQRAGRRSIEREEPASADVAAPEPTAAEVAAVVEELHLAVNSLGSDERKVLACLLAGQSVAEIGAEIAKSERTARRLVAEVKRTLEERLLQQSPEAPAVRRMPEPAAPLRYSDYVLEQLLAAGGMGKVFRARERMTGKPVAIKALHKSRLADERAVARFVQEAEILARLRHPNIVGVQGLGRFPSGGYFLVMDFIDGEDLQSRLARGALPAREAMRIVKDVAEATQSAHDAGVVHCDLKPANVLIDQSGRIYVTDFGFACLIARSPEFTTSARQMRTTGIGGTAGYIAPEILLHAAPPTPAADVYALGVLLRTLVSGQPPSGVTFEPGSERDDRELLSRLNVVWQRCLASEPGDRYGSPAELARAVEMIEGGSKPAIVAEQ